MHLGQTSAYLARVLNRPEPTIQMVGRRLREAGKVQKGGRGRSAPHVKADELAAFLIALMASPDSPTMAMERLPHFAALPLDSETGRTATFAEAFATLLERLASETWEEASAKNWAVTARIDVSGASISAQPAEGSGGIAAEEHDFTALVTADPARPLKDALPYHGLEETRTIECLALFRIAKAVLAGEPDPLGEIACSMLADTDPQEASA